jgi:hypothetical protein
VTSGSIVERSEQDPLVEIDGGPGNRQRAEQAEHPSAAADLGGAGRAALDVGGQAGGIGRRELIEQERIDQGAGTCAIQGVANVRVRHNIYMT